MSTPPVVHLSEIRDLLSRILGVPSDGAPSLARGGLDQWDSLKHMEIVFALEDRYGVQFDESEFQTLESPEAIMAAVQRHLAA